MYCSKIKKTAGLLVCSLAFQFPAFAENTECPKVKNLSTDTFDKVLKWEVEGDNYEGAEVYTVTADGELEYFGNAENMKAHMMKHAAIMRPKFEAVLEVLDRELTGLGIGTWVRPNGGYFISFDAMKGCAKEIIKKCKETLSYHTGSAYDPAA